MSLATAICLVSMENVTRAQVVGKARKTGEWQAYMQYLSLLYMSSNTCVVRDVSQKNGKLKAHSHSE